MDRGTDRHGPLPGEARRNLFRGERKRDCSSPKNFVGATCGCGATGSASRCQREGRGFDPRHPHHGPGLRAVEKAHAPLAQLVEVTVLDAVGSRFESGEGYLEAWLTFTGSDPGEGEVDSRPRKRYPMRSESRRLYTGGDRPESGVSDHGHVRWQDP